MRPETFFEHGFETLKEMIALKILYTPSLLLRYDFVFDLMHKISKRLSLNDSSFAREREKNLN